jgi:Tfp pilus assembly protein PilN
MIQFNLLPDIKIQYIRARRQKHLVLMISGIAIAASLVTLVVLFSTASIIQKKSISDLNKDIKAASNELKSTPDLTKMLTVQNQLKVLPELHEDKPMASRIFSYVAQVTPSEASISRMLVDFDTKTMTISGSAVSLEVVNTYTDTLKFATYHTENDRAKEAQAFTDVVLSSFGRDAKGASYTITLTFDPIIFDNTQEVTLTVPNKITTRSQTEQPEALFQEAEGQ